MIMNRRIALPSFIVLILLATTGCGGYALRGQVISGPYNSVELVPSDDPRLKESGLSGVRIEAIRDPDSLSKNVAASTMSGGNGTVTLMIGEFGAGWMDEQWDLRASMGGDWFAQNRVSLPKPGSNLRLLVVVSPGTGSTRSSMDEEQERRLKESGISIPDSSIYRR
jgi:hypothetical protein